MVEEVTEEVGGGRKALGVYARGKATNSCVSFSMGGHQKRRRKNDRVRVEPGWQVSLDEWPHCSTYERTQAGTKRVWGGPPPGSGNLVSGPSSSSGSIPENSGQGVGLDVTGPQSLGEGEVIPLKEQSPPGMTVVQSLH